VIVPIQLFIGDPAVTKVLAALTDGGPSMADVALAGLLTPEDLTS
jgi:hypothetical protein